MLSAAVLSLTAACSKGGGEIPPYEPSGINLTAGAAYANCFIVDEAGDYWFEARHVDGSAVQDAVAADWVWSTDDADPDGLISEVEWHDGIISFKASEGRGNALIAAFDSDGEVVWSWHVWLTEQPALQTMDNGTVFMDRNLGAMSAAPEDVAKTYGLKYQWGRKDPFYGGDVNEEKGAAFSQARAATVFNPACGFDWAVAESDPSVGTMEFAAANPCTFIYSEDKENGCDWLAVRNDWLWCDEATGAKTNHDPCPAGYIVAFDGAWEGCGYWNVDDDPVNGGRTHVTESGEKFWWPLSGHRWGDADAGQLDYVGPNGAGTIWMRTTVNTGYNASCFYYHQGTYMATSYAMYRSYGEAVRCVKEASGK